MNSEVNILLVAVVILGLLCMAQHIALIVGYKVMKMWRLRARLAQEKLTTTDQAEVDKVFDRIVDL